MPGPLRSTPAPGSGEPGVSPASGVSPAFGGRVPAQGAASAAVLAAAGRRSAASGARDANRWGSGARARTGAADAPLASRRELALALVACGALALAWTLPLAARTAWGWDETMHAELPAVRVLLALRAGESRAALDAVLACERYPFAYPLVLALAQAVGGISEHVCRVTGTLVWCATLLGLFLVGAELRRGFARRGEPRGAVALPWLALGAGASSPLALGFAGTLFLEVPFACAAVFCLRAWIRRRPFAELPAGLARRRDLAAGAWLAVALFTKLNYGLLLWAALALDAALQAVRALRAERGGRGAEVGAARGAGLRVPSADERGGARGTAVLARLAWTALPPAALCLWWFALPWPAGPETAASHRAALVEFLGGNRQLAPAPWTQRVLYLTASFAPTARAAVALVVGVGLALFAVARTEVRPVALALLALAGGVLLHPFHQDRFLIPVGVPLWLLAATGWAAVLPARPGRAALAAGALALACGAFPGVDAPLVAERLGLLRAEPVVRAYQLELLAGWRDLSGDRALRSSGLSRATHDELSDLLAGALGPTERVGWVGISSEYSPAALHVALLERGGAPERFRRDAHRRGYVTFEGVDPGWSSAELAAFAAEHDALVATDPPDLKARPGRAFLRGYQERVVGELGWNAERLGRIEVERALAAPLGVDVWLLRPPAR